MAGASVHLLIGNDDISQSQADGQGRFNFDALIPGVYSLRAQAPDFVTVTQPFRLPGDQEVDLRSGISPPSIRAW